MYAFYGGDLTRSVPVQWVLEEGGLDYELRRLDIFAGEHKASAFLAINPAGLVPVLVWGRPRIGAGLGSAPAWRRSKGWRRPMRA